MIRFLLLICIVQKFSSGNRLDTFWLRVGEFSGAPNSNLGSLAAISTDVVIFEASSPEIVDVLAVSLKDDRVLTGNNIDYKANGSISAICVGNNIVTMGQPNIENQCGRVIVWNMTSYAQQLLCVNCFQDSYQFGYSVAVNNDANIFVGSPTYKQQGIESGAVYVHVFNHDQWSCQQLLSTGIHLSHFGHSLAVWGKWLAVGAPLYSTDGGAVYLYAPLSATDGGGGGRGGGGAWSMQQRLEGNADNGRFGLTIAGITDLIAVTVGDDAAVYLYQHSSGQEWSLLQVLEHEDVSADFGFSLFATPGLLFVGAPHDSTYEADLGAVYVFSRQYDDVMWSQQHLLYEPGALLLGTSLAAQGPLLMIGAPGTNDSAGAVYYYEGGHTSRPTSLPSSAPSSQPSLQPLAAPSARPSMQPHACPSVSPSCSPSCRPTLQPVSSPSFRPSARPTWAPMSTAPQASPSALPSCSPSAPPSLRPSSGPSLQPITTTPTSRPESAPSALPTSFPTINLDNDRNRLFSVQLWSTPRDQQQQIQHIISNIGNNRNSSILVQIIATFSSAGCMSITLGQDQQSAAVLRMQCCSRHHATVPQACQVTAQQCVVNRDISSVVTAADGGSLAILATGRIGQQKALACVIPHHGGATFGVEVVLYARPIPTSMPSPQPTAVGPLSISRDGVYAITLFPVLIMVELLVWRVLVVRAGCATLEAVTRPLAICSSLICTVLIVTEIWIVVSTFTNVHFDILSSELAVVAILIGVRLSQSIPFILVFMQLREHNNCFSHFARGIVGRIVMDSNCWGEHWAMCGVLSALSLLQPDFGLLLPWTGNAMPMTTHHLGFPNNQLHHAWLVLTLLHVAIVGVCAVVVESGAVAQLTHLQSRCAWQWLVLSCALVCQGLLCWFKCARISRNLSSQQMDEKMSQGSDNKGDVTESPLHSASHANAECDTGCNVDEEGVQLIPRDLMSLGSSAVADLKVLKRMPVSDTAAVTAKSVTAAAAERDYSLVQQQSDY